MLKQNYQIHEYTIKLPTISCTSNCEFKPWNQDNNELESKRDFDGTQDFWILSHEKCHKWEKADALTSKYLFFFFLEELSLIKIFQFFSEGCQQRSKEKLYLKASLSISPSIRCSKLLRSMQLSLAHKNKNRPTNIYIFTYIIYIYMYIYVYILTIWVYVFSFKSFEK